MRLLSILCKRFARQRRRPMRTHPVIVGVVAIALGAFAAPLIDVSIASATLTVSTVTQAPTPVAPGETTTLTIPVLYSGNGDQYVALAGSHSDPAYGLHLWLGDRSHLCSDEYSTPVDYQVTVTPSTSITPGSHSLGNVSVKDYSNNSCNSSGTAATAALTVSVAGFSFTTQPPNGATGTALSPAPAVTYLNTSDTAVNNAPIAISASGCGTLSGTTSVNTNSSGVATFSNLILSAAGSGCTLTATTSSGVTGGSLSTTSNTFVMTSPATKIVLSGSTANLTAVDAGDHCHHRGRQRQHRHDRF